MIQQSSQGELLKMWVYLNRSFGLLSTKWISLYTCLRSKVGDNARKFCHIILKVDEYTSFFKRILWADDSQFTREGTIKFITYCTCQINMSSTY